MDKVSLPQIIAFSISFIGLVSVILLVALRDLKNKVNQNFLWFALLVLIYLTATFVDDFTPLNISLWILRFDLFVANMIPATFLAFTLSFSGNKIGSKIANNIIYLALIPLSVIAFLPFTVTGASAGKYGTNITENGPLYYLTLIYFLGVLSYAFAILIKNAGRSDRVTKLQTGFIIFGLGTTVGLNLITVFLFPLLGQGFVDAGNLIGGPSIVILVASLVYAVLGQHMFDVRGLIIRTLSFFVITGVLSGAFIFLLIFSASRLITGFNPNTAVYVFFMSSAAIGGVLIKPAFDFLEKRFSSIFATEKYDPQTVLNKVGALISSTVDISDLFAAVSEVITSNMGVKRVDSVALNNGEVIYRSTDVNSYPTNEEFSLLGNENINIDETVDQQKLVILRKYGVNFYIVLKSQDETLGYLLVGPKNNGLAYDTSDIKTLLNIAGQLSVALKNVAYYFQIQSFNKTLEKKVEESTEKLRQTNERLKEADESKDDFISMASHQLSTPIASIEGYLSMANNGYLGELNPKLADALRAAAGRASVMKGIISDLLNVSHMAAGKFSLDLAPTDLEAIIKDELKQSKQLADQQHTDLTFHDPGVEINEIVCDGPKVRQVVANFVNNALHYTPKGHVDVYISKKADGLEVLVRDDGIGVPADQQAHLFQKFFRAENAKKERPSGNGIGLYVAKKVVEEHGGKIIFQSTQGHGSTFGFFLPFKPIGYAPKTKPPVFATQAKG